VEIKLRKYEVFILMLYIKTMLVHMVPNCYSFLYRKSVMTCFMSYEICEKLSLKCSSLSIGVGVLIQYRN